ncbi:phosphate ABC transporter permease subunit PstC, partial [Candidatus Nanopelagicales bacterium]|nr:phosphate ABC transporter permease subunit PstC [Candidatus Nanopelagicales bacterium]
MSLLTPPRLDGSSVRPGDRNFRFITTGAGIAVLVVLAAIAAFLVWKSIPALQNNTGNIFTNQQWLPDSDPPSWGIAVLIFGTIWTSVIAMAIAVPIGIGTALYITFYAPRRIARTLGFIVDLLAAVPSIIFGLWGLYYFMPEIVPAAQWLSTYLGWLPIFSNDLDLYTKSILIAGFVLAIMILPTVS